MSKIRVLLVCCGSHTPPIFQLEDSKWFEYSGIVELRTRKEYEERIGDYENEILDFAGLPKEGTVSSFRNKISIVTGLGVSSSPPVADPRIVVFVEDIWKDDPRVDNLERIMKPILLNPLWRNFALEKGVIACLLTDNADSLGSKMGRSKRLINMGVDLYLSLADYCAVSINLGESEKRVEELVRRRFELLTRQRVWALNSVFSGVRTAIGWLAVAALIQTVVPFLFNLMCSVAKCILQDS